MTSFFEISGDVFHDVVKHTNRCIRLADPKGSDYVEQWSDELHLKSERNISITKSDKGARQTRTQYWKYYARKADQYNGLSSYVVGKSTPLQYSYRFSDKE